MCRIPPASAQQPYRGQTKFENLETIQLLRKDGSAVGKDRLKQVEGYSSNKCKIGKIFQRVCISNNIRGLIFGLVRKRKVRRDRKSSVYNIKEYIIIMEQRRGIFQCISNVSNHLFTSLSSLSQTHCKRDSRLHSIRNAFPRADVAE